MSMKMSIKQYIINEYSKMSEFTIDDNIIDTVISAPIKKYYLVYHPQKEIIEKLLHIKHKYYSLDFNI